MQKKRTGLLFLMFLVLSTIVACSKSNEKTITTELEINVSGPALQSRNIVSSRISLGEISPEFFAYNMSSNSLTLISRFETTYTLYRLRADGTLQDPGIHWRIPKDYSLDNFVYSPDGSFYAVLKHYDKKGKTHQSLVLLQNRGTYKTIKLNNLNEVPNTDLDSYVKKKGKKSDRSITDIQFSGTALSITYSNYAVKFYNISEGMPLGDTSITGTSGHNVFYDNLFITTGLTHGRKSTINYYDIRNGEKTNSVRMDDILYLTNYREKLYLLTKDSIYQSLASTPSFTKAVSIHGLNLPTEAQNLKLYAAREDKLYLAYQDGNGQFLLYRIDLSI